MSVVITGKTKKELLELRSKITAQAKQYIAENESSWNWKNDDAHAKMVKDIGMITEALEKYEQFQGGKITTSMLGDPMESPSRSKSRSFGEGTDERVTILNSSESFVSKFGTSDVSLADVIRAKVLGESASLNSNIGEDGGFLKQVQMSSEVIDLARSKSVLVRAGMQMAEMSQSELRMPKVTGDPTFEVKVENDDFTEDETLKFGAIAFYPVLIGTFISMSREIAEDSANFTNVVNDAIAASFAVQIDRFPLLGMASQRAQIGLLDDPTIPETPSTGTLTFGKLAAGATAIRTANHEPRSILLHPSRRDAVLDSVASGSGEYLGVPPSLEGVQMLDTTSIPIDKCLIGDFRKLILAVRGGPAVEATTLGGKAFKAHQIHIKLYWRGSFGVTHPEAFRRLAGIS